MTSSVPPFAKAFIRAAKKAFTKAGKKASTRARREEVLKLLGRLVAKRFGPLPAPLDERLTNMSIAELEELSLRVLDAHSIDELFHP